MATDADRELVRRLLAEGAQVVDVLAPEEFDEERLPGAINIPLKELDAETAAARIRRDAPVVVYCHDSQ